MHKMSIVFHIILNSYGEVTAIRIQSVHVNVIDDRVASHLCFIFIVEILIQALNSVTTDHDHI